MIHAEDERSFDTALRGMAYPLTQHHTVRYDQLVVIELARCPRASVASAPAVNQLGLSSGAT